MSPVMSKLSRALPPRSNTVAVVLEATRTRVGETAICGFGGSALVLAPVAPVKLSRFSSGDVPAADRAPPLELLKPALTRRARVGEAESLTGAAPASRAVAVPFNGPCGACDQYALPSRPMRRPGAGACKRDESTGSRLIRVAARAETVPAGRMTPWVTGTS